LTPPAAFATGRSMGARKGLTGKTVRFRRGPAAVTGDESRKQATAAPKRGGKARPPG